jgi:hypothetical protein
MRYGFINNFSQTLAAELAAGATEMTLDGGGSSLSNASADLVYTLTLDDAAGTVEIVHVTGATGNDLTIERGKEGTADAAWPSGTTVEMRVTAGVMGWLDVRKSDPDTNNVVLGGATNESNDSYASCVIVGESAYNNDSTGSNSYENTIVGAWAGAGQWAESVILGTGADLRFGSSPVYGGVAVGAYSSVRGDSGQSVAVGYSARVNADSPDSVAVGSSARVGFNSPGGSSFGAGAEANAPESVAIGHNANTTGDNSVAVGLDADSRATDGVALGPRSLVVADGGVALGPGAQCLIPGGLRVHGVPYLSNAIADASAGAQPGVANRSSSGIVIQTDPLDLTDGAAVVTLDMPTGTMLFIDAIDVVIVSSATPGGAPEIRIGPDDVTPADYLAATPVTATAVGERLTHAPLVADGVTSLRVETATAGTGTLAAKVVFRGYVMEL